MWWPSHRPLEVSTEQGELSVWARGIPQTNEGDFKMVTAWKYLGFIRGRVATDPKTAPAYFEVERDDDALGPAVEEGIPYSKKSDESK